MLSCCPVSDMLHQQVCSHLTGLNTFYGHLILKCKLFKNNMMQQRRHKTNKYSTFCKKWSGIHQMPSQLLILVFVLIFCIANYCPQHLQMQDCKLEYHSMNEIWGRRISGKGVYWGKGESHEFSKKAWKPVVPIGLLLLLPKKSLGWVKNVTFWVIQKNMNFDRKWVENVWYSRAFISSTKV